MEEGDENLQAVYGLYVRIGSEEKGYETILMNSHHLLQIVVEEK